jgi:hypothetical protein
MVVGLVQIQLLYNNTDKWCNILDTPGARKTIECGELGNQPIGEKSYLVHLFCKKFIIFILWSEYD